MFSLAERLGKTIQELGDMTVSEFNGWIAYSTRK